MKKDKLVNLLFEVYDDGLHQRDCNLTTYSEKIEGAKKFQTLLSMARQMQLEQQRKIDSYTEHYNEYEIGTLNGIKRIVKLIERQLV